MRFNTISFTTRYLPYDRRVQQRTRNYNLGNVDGNTNKADCRGRYPCFSRNVYTTTDDRYRLTTINYHYYIIILLI